MVLLTASYQCDVMRRAAHTMATTARMVVDSLESKADPASRRLYEASRSRLREAGYNLDGCELQMIHCNTQPGCERFSFMQNGFIQTFTTVDGRSARVMDYAPSQTLQPHKHDIHELFEIRGGRALVSKWPLDPTKASSHCY